MIQVENLSKTYAERTAVDDASFVVPAGQITGFIGANGAGKSTVMRMIMGLTNPDHGSITVDGTPIHRDYRARIAYMPEEQGLYPEMPVRTQLLFFAQLQGLSKRIAVDTVDGLLERLGLTERARDAVSKLSLGNRQRVQLASALLRPPTALILDEPFSGLDPLAVDYMESVLRDYAKEGVPILFSSHQLELVERLCDRLTIITKGKVKASARIDELVQGPSNSFILRYQGNRDQIMRQLDLPLGAALVRNAPEQGILVVNIDPGSERSVLRELVSNYDVLEMQRAKSTLTESYRELISEGSNEF